ncbi:MAG: twitching motility protein PilT [Clostridium sp.]|nr:twitching motility protein PilT [Clostridium sp.]
MVQIIAGETGKGKTKELLRMVNDEVRTTYGRIVYLDKSYRHMYELSNKIRLVNVKDYLTVSSEEFLGFLSGIVSQDNDIEKIYVDSFLKVACADISQLEYLLQKIDERSKQFKVDFVLSVSLEKEQLPPAYQKSVILSL